MTVISVTVRGDASGNQLADRRMGANLVTLLLPRRSGSALDNATRALSAHGEIGNLFRHAQAAVAQEE